MTKELIKTVFMATMVTKHGIHILFDIFFIIVVPSTLLITYSKKLQRKKDVKKVGK